MPPVEPPRHRAPELEPLDHYLDYLVMERVAELTEKVFRRDPEVQRIRHGFGNFLQVVENLIPSPEGAAVLGALHENSARMESRLQELAYRQGLEDGVKLNGILRQRDRDSPDSR
jgi:hypothetical protein